MAAESAPDEALPLVARRLDALFRAKLAPSGKEFSYKHVERVINEAAGEKAISHSYIWQIRKGKSANPTRNAMALLAAFFSVPSSYFFDDVEADRMAEQMDVAEALSNDLVREIAVRANGLSDGSLTAVLAMVSSLRAAEGLPSVSSENSAH